MIDRDVAPRRDGRRWTSLRVRLAVLLSIAILPLGVVAVVQTTAVVREAQRLERSDLMLRTLRAATTERALLRRAYGAADALGAAAFGTSTDTAACIRIMDHFVSDNSSFIFAGVMDSDGIMRCGAGGATQDFSQSTEWADFVGDPRPTIVYVADGAVSRQPVLVASMPVWAPDGSLWGASAVSLPGALFDTLSDPQFDGVRLALVDADGTVLAASDEAARIERLGLVPARLPVGNAGHMQEIVTADGQTELAVLVPLVGERVYVLGLWEGQTEAMAIPLLGTGVPLFPILMWMIALGVGILAADRLVLAPLSRLRARMAHLSFDDPSRSFAFLPDAPREITEIAETYNRMVDRILGDRTELAEALAEKELLLREVHHRVKNNLQLIASMINIQIRSVPEGPSRTILRRMQDRVLSLSSIHKALYAGQTLARVRADSLMTDVIQSTLTIGVPAGAGVNTTLDCDPVMLDPDQAVPLTLLASELTTNAVKYIGVPVGGGAPFIRLSLDLAEEDVLLTVENTLGTPLRTEDETGTGTGLGAQLIEAFVSQLGATVQIDQTSSVYAVRVLCPGLAMAAPDLDEDTDEDDVAA